MNMVSEPLSSAQAGRYGKPPAVEVIFNIRTALPQPIDPALFLDSVYKTFPNTFTEHKEFRTLEGDVKVNVDGTTDGNVTSQLSGYRFMAPDKSMLAHYLLNGLTLNFLPPYAGYARSLQVFKEHWGLYKRLTGNAPVTALALRYIDRIDIPRDGDTMVLSDYFTIAPPTHGLLAHGCYLQYFLNDEQRDIRARVIWSSLENKPDHWSFALDTEATLDPAEVSEDASIWEHFTRLHDWCTNVFEQSLTPQCKQLFM